MTDYVFIPDNPAGYSLFSGGASGTVNPDGSASVTLPASLGEAYTPYFDPDSAWLTDPAIVASIAGIRVDFTVTSGTGQLAVILTAENAGGGDRRDASSIVGATYPTVGPGVYSYALGVDLAWIFGGALSASQVAARAAVSASPPRFYAEVFNSDAATVLELSGFKVVAFTLDSIGGPPLIQWPRWDGKRTVRRLWPPPGNQQ